MFEIKLKDNKGNELRTVPCAGSSCTIGRAGKNLISLKGWRIAASNAEISTQPKGLFVLDTSKGIGIKVNGTMVTSFGPLSREDEIRIGEYSLCVVPENPSSIPEPLAQVPFVPPPEGHLKLREEAVKKEPGTNPLEPVDNDNGERYLVHNRIHQKLMLAMDLRRTDVAAMDDGELRNVVASLIDEIIAQNTGNIPAQIDRASLALDVLNEAVGLGPLEGLLADDDITEIMINGHEDIYIEKGGRLQKTGIHFSGNDAVMAVIERIVSPLGRRIDESSPMVDGRLKDGSRINAIIPPLAIKGPTLTIRKFFKQKLTMERLIGFGALSPDMAEFLETAVTNKKNIIISGGTGSGKTTFLNVLSNYIPSGERIITVEDSAELSLNQPHVVSLEARPANMEGSGGIFIRDLVKNCLRMRPDRIVVGECRGSEALDMLQAMNTGHDGSLTTAHANTPRDLMARLGVMVMMSGMELPDQAVREQIASAIDIVVQQARFPDGSRKITHITEITGMESGTVQMQNIFIYRQKGFDKDHRVWGEFTATGRVPEFYEELGSRGIPVNMNLFSKEQP
ncbi:MAG: CpaF family protein [Proteobacteria bacterium]|nr:CpaF family protein [Pseudomonadota bacterium]